jgi:hypothetical protein
MTKTHRPPETELFALYGSPYRPSMCPCGCSEPMMDLRHLRGRKGPYFVWCPDCDCVGPQRPTYALALAAWNRAIYLHDHSEILVVDNSTS